MKLKKLKLNNFHKFVDFEIEFDEKVTRLRGVNGSGKTTVGLTAIWAAFKGISERGKDVVIGNRYKFIGPLKASADIELTLIDTVKNNTEIVVSNHITKASNSIKFDAPDDYPIDNEWLNNLLSITFLSAKNFCQMDSKKQAVSLGIDTSEFDAKISELKQEYTLINREIRNFGEIQEVEKVERVSVSDLVKEKDEIEAFNQEQWLSQQEIDRKNNSIVDVQDEMERIQIGIDQLQQALARNKSIVSDLKAELKKLPVPKKKKSVDPIVAKIESAEETNEKATQYHQYLDQKKAKESKNKELKKNSDAQKKVEKKKLDYIKSFDFGFDGLGVDGKGNLLLNDRPIKEPYFSKGELELIVARLHSSQHQDMKFRFVDDFDLLDEENQARLIDGLLEKGFQIILSEVGTKKETKDHTVLLRECKQVDDYDEKQETLF